MRLRRLLICVAMTVLAIGVVGGCAKKDSQKPTTVSGENVTTQEETEETTSKVNEEVTTEGKQLGEGVPTDEIVLINPFTVSFAEGKEGTQMPATPEIEFDSGAELSIYQLTWVEIGNRSTDMGYLKLEDLFDAGLVGNNGETVYKVETSGWMDVYTKDLSIAVYDYEEGNPYVAELHIDKNYHGDGKNYADIPLKITELGLEIGQSVEVLKPLGTPDYAMLIEGKYYYYWQVETEDKGCCVEVVTKDGIIESLAIAAF